MTQQRSWGRRRPVASLVVALAILATIAGAPTAQAAPGPTLDEAPAALEQALECSPGVDAATATPLLLVHGTWTDPQDSWTWGYRRVLPAAGIPACTVTLPDLAFGDAQRSVEYVVQAIRRIHKRAGRRISVIGHSQGGMLVNLAVRVWPDLAAKLDDVIGLAAVHQGSAYFSSLCELRCFPAAWQMRVGSELIAAINRRPLPAGPAYTSIFTGPDEFVSPQPYASTLPGARNIAVQGICPARPVEHVGILGDAVAHALVLDALRHAGPASPDRIPPLTCMQAVMPGADLVALPVALAAFPVKQLLGAAYPSPPAEPPLRCYLDPTCAG